MSPSLNPQLLIPSYQSPAASKKRLRESEALFLAFAEGTFQDLAGGIFRECVHGDEAFRDLVAGDIFHHVFADLVFVEGVAFFHDDVGPDDLAAEGIGLADDGTFSDAFDFVDAVFDFAGRRCRCSGLRPCRRGRRCGASRLR